MYVKLFTSIYQGTLRGRPHGLLVFTNLLAHADVHGIVDIHPNAIADEVGLSVEQVKTALLELESVDPESRSPENEGRRIVRMDGHRAWGWQIVNYGKYRSIRNEDDRREQNREAQARWREKNKPPSAEISSVSHDKPMQKQKEMQKNKEEIQKPTGFTLPDWINSSHWETWHSSPKRKKATNAQKQMAIDKLGGWRDKGLDFAGALENAAMGGYQGLFLPDNKTQSTGETVYQRSMREKMEKIVPSIAAKAPGIKRIDPNTFFDVEPKLIGGKNGNH
jgi:hypothetical protein